MLAVGGRYGEAALQGDRWADGVEGSATARARGRIDTRHLKHLAGLTRLEVLSLFRTKVTDRQLAAPAPFRRLQSLDLTESKITDEGLKHLAGLTRLRTLNLSWNRVCDRA